MDERFDERLLDAAVNGEISHGSYTYHNVLIGGKDTYVVNLTDIRMSARLVICTSS